MPIPLGILAAAGVRAAGGSYELIETITVGSGGAASVTFSNLNTYSTTYQHLQIRLTARHTSSNSYGLSEIDLQMNGDTGNNYSIHGLVGDGASVTSYGAANTGVARIAYFTSAQAVSGAFSGAVIDILDPYEAKNKTIRSLSGALSGFNGIDPDQAVALFSSVWRNTNSLTSITLFRTALTFAQGSRFSIYGLKAS